MTSGNAENPAPVFTSVDHAAVSWIEANDDYVRLSKLYRAADARRKSAGEYLDEHLTAGNMIEVEGRRYRFLYKLRDTPRWKDAFMAIRSIVSNEQQVVMDRAVETNTNHTETPALEEVPVNG